MYAVDVNREGHAKTYFDSFEALKDAFFGGRR